MFIWDASPTNVFSPNADKWAAALIDAIYGLMRTEAPLIQQFMRDNAPWKDTHMPSREYLKAEAFKDDENNVVGIVAYYDLETYRTAVPEPWSEWGIAHETFTFANAGIISIILPRRSPTVLGEKAEEVMMKVRALLS